MGGLAHYRYFIRLQGFLVNFNSEMDLFLNPVFFSGIIFIILSVVLFERNKIRISLLGLFVGSIFIGIFISLLDPFIHLWDEQFHALVAKNMTENPFKPILIKEPILGYTPGAWSYCYIWLHKQPVFLWQMALSIKLFGANELGVRFPSVIMHALLVFFIYRVGKIFYSSKVGFYAALLFSASYFPLEYLTGFYATDHNDIAYLFYGFLSIWALVEYYHSGKKSYVILIGLFAGLTVLNKWLLGLLVFASWALIIVSGWKNPSRNKEIVHFLYSLTICVLIFIPWQIYCYSNFPVEYATAMDFNRRHITEVLEGHGGSVLFYYDALFEQFGEGLLTPLLLITSVIIALTFLKNARFKIIFGCTIILIYLFFTIVKTKMFGYVYVTFPFFIISLSMCLIALIDYLTERTKLAAFKGAITGILMVIIAYLMFNSHKIYKHHGPNVKESESRLLKIKEKELYLSLKEELSGQKCAVINCQTSLNGHLPCIFYADFPAVFYSPSASEIVEIKRLGYKVIAIDNGQLPERIKNDTSIAKKTW